MPVDNAPDKLSSDYVAMLDYWTRVRDLNNGTDAMRAAGQAYLPKFENESQASYDDRVKWARFTNIYSDIVENIADRPFAKEVVISEGSERVKALAEDIDGQGNNFHKFAAEYFRNAMDYGIDWIFVDYTQTDATTLDANGKVRRKSVLEEKQSGARPYWMRVSALEMIAVYSAMIDGVEEFVHCRMRECYTERSGWEEIEVVQIRELNREIVFNEDGKPIGLGNATFRVWRQEFGVNASGRRTKSLVWNLIDEGEIAIGVIPIVPLVIGQRKGNTWRLVPAMKSVAYLQFEYYEQENGLKNIKKMTAFPMFSASGISPDKDEKGNPLPVNVGPRAVLYGPMSDAGTPGRWEIIEPSATSMTFLKEDLKELGKEMRELGRQPLTQSSGQLTTTTTNVAAAKGTSAVQAWALDLKDSLELALFYTAMWMNETVEPTVTVDIDFDHNSSDDQTFDAVQTMRKDGDLSQETLWEEAKRRKIVGDDFTIERERERLDAEMPEGDDELILSGQRIDPKTGLPIVEEEVMSPDDEVTSPTEEEE